MPSPPSTGCRAAIARGVAEGVVAVPGRNSVSMPAPPLSVSLPAPPSSRLAPALPVMLSLPRATDHVFDGYQGILDRASAKPRCALPVARSMNMAAFSPA